MDHSLTAVKHHKGCHLLPTWQLGNEASILRTFSDSGKGKAFFLALPLPPSREGAVPVLIKWYFIPRYFMRTGVKNLGNGRPVSHIHDS